VKSRDAPSRIVLEAIVREAIVEGRYGVTRLGERLGAALSTPWAWHFLRKLPEFDYRQTKGRIRSILGDEGGTVLDLGCGTGEYAPLFSPERYVGLDMWTPFVRYASTRLRDFSFLVGDGERLPFPDDRFQRVLVNGVIHHMGDANADRLLEEVSRVVRPSGAVLIIEDVPSSALNLPGRLMHAMDQGDHIRTAEAYGALIGRHLSIRRTEAYRSGICEYALFETAPHG
jgi:SAM-dependent methyltransferase